MSPRQGHHRRPFVTSSLRAERGLDSPIPIELGERGDHWGVLRVFEHMGPDTLLILQKRATSVRDQCRESVSGYDQVTDLLLGDTHDAHAL
jgi:hypothetical protein